MIEGMVIGACMAVVFVLGFITGDTWGDALWEWAERRRNLR